MNDEQLERRLRDWYRIEIPVDEQAPPDLRSGLALVPRVSALPRRRLGGRRGVTLFAAAALVGVLAGSAVVGSRFLIQPPVPPVVPSQLPSQRPSPLPSELRSDPPSIAPATGRIVYTRWRTLARGEEDCTTKAFSCYRASVVISNQDGSDEKVLFPEPSSIVLAASSDGSRLIVSLRGSDGNSHPFITDVDGSAPRPLDTRCQLPCREDFGFTFSADGSRLAFARSRLGKPGADETQVVATMDMASGAVVELESSQPYWGRPGLSSDGTRVAFGNHVVDVDGNNLRQIAPADLFTDLQPGVFSAGVAAPQWSPDGSLIAFTSFNDTFPTNPPERNSQRRMDIWVVRPDGTDLHRLTTDTVGSLGTNEAGDFGASFPTWTGDGRIAFSRHPERTDDLLELWVMDADGSNASRLDTSNAAALTAVGCVECPYRPGGRLASVVPSFGFWISVR